MNEPDGDEKRVWLVERTYSDDELNLLILTYATLDGQQYHRKERAITSAAAGMEAAVAAVVDPDDLGAVTDPETRDWYASEAQRMADLYQPDDTV